MDSHPIPQDVTGFQFKLIGAMTVKQFMYLAVPAVVDWLVLEAPLLPVFIKIPLLLLFAVLGLTLAFLPIEGRPADIMFKHFIDALFAANQYTYKKTGQKLAFTTLSSAALRPKKNQTATNAQAEQAKMRQLKALLSASSHQEALDERESTFMQAINTFSSPQHASPSMQKAGLPFHLPQFSLNPIKQVSPPNEKTEKPAVKETPTPLTRSQPVLSNFKTVDMGKPSLPVQPLQAAPVGRLTMPSMTPVDVSFPTSPMPNVQPAALPQIPLPDMEKQLAQLQEEKQKIDIVMKKTEKAAPPEKTIQSSEPQKNAQPQIIVNPLEQLQKLSEIPPTPLPVTPLAAPVPPTPPPPQTQPITSAPNMTAQVANPQAPHVAKIPKTLAKNMGLPNVPDSPNVISGIVRDPRGNVLANILVEVKDKQGNPVRAFKTNQLGQFASATPLQNGTFTITFEDLSGVQRFDTIEIVAKGTLLLPISVISHDAREELRKALFT